MRTDRLPAEFLGARFTLELIDALEQRGIDPCGEYGEYHTVVLACPAYDRELVIERALPRVAADHAHWNIRNWHTRSRTSPSNWAASDADEQEP